MADICIHGVDLDIACNLCSPPFVPLSFKVTERLDIKKGLEISNPEAIKKLELKDLPVRQSPVEICEHCGAEFRGLYHCQSLEGIKEIDDEGLLKHVEEAVGVVGPIKWSAREVVGIGIIDPERVQKDKDGNSVLVPTSAGEE